MANVIEHRKFVFVNAAGNNSKTWQVSLFDNDDVEVQYGRIGKSLQSKVHVGAGRDKMDKLIREKTKPSDHYNGGCYREIEVLDSISATSKSVSSKTELKEIAKKQIATCAITQKLIEFFTEVNAHDIYQATGGRITYDVSAGTFSTPIGIVTKNNVDSARKLLDDLTDFINKGNFSKKFITTLEDYLMLIPQDVGRKFDPQAFCGDVAAIQRQSQILDGLDASIDAVLSASMPNVKTKAKVDEPKLFNVKMAVVEDGKEIDRIQHQFHKTSKDVHVTSRMKLRQAYTVNISFMVESWDKDGSKLGCHQELYHGTKSSNCLSILKHGFVIPPASASHVCGSMFSRGIYFSNSSTKSLNYATSYWGGRDEGRYFMFICKVALGNYHVPNGPTSARPPKGYDSYWAKAGRSGVSNDELIVFRTSQILPVYLTEWK